MLSIHSLHGLLLLSVPSTIPNISVFNFLLSSILTVGVSCVHAHGLFVADPFQFWVFHIFHGLFFLLCPTDTYNNRSFSNSTSQLTTVCLCFCCMSRFHTHTPLCWMLLFPIYVFVSLLMFLLFQIFSMDFVTFIALLILLHKFCKQSLSYVNILPRYGNCVTFFKV